MTGWRKIIKDQSAYSPAFLKDTRKIILEQIGTHFENICSPYLSSFRKRYAGCQNVLMQMTEKWCNTLDNKKVIAALSMDLSKAFDSLPHNILIAKHHAYGFHKN